MEFIARRTGWLKEQSLLDTDDLNGPGTCNYKKLTGNQDTDFALFLLGAYSRTKNNNQRLEFVQKLGELGRHIPEEILVQLLTYYASDISEVKQSLANQLPRLFCHFPAPLLLEVLDTLLNDSDYKVLENACRCVIESDIQIPDTTVTLILKILHDDIFEVKMLGLETIRAIISKLDSRILMHFVTPDIMALTFDSIISIQKQALLCIPSLISQVNDSNYTNKLLGVVSMVIENNYINSVHSEVLADLFEVCDENAQKDSLLPLLMKQDKKQLSSSIGKVLYFFKGNPPQELFEIYKESCKNSNSQYRSAKWLKGLVSKNFWESWRDVLSYLAKDGSIQTKTYLCSVLHEFELNPNVYKEVLLPIYSKLTNQSYEISSKILLIFGEFMGKLDLSSRHLMESLLTKHYKHKNWRMRRNLASQMEKVADLYPADRVLQDLWPVLMSFVVDKYEAVKVAAARGIGAAVIAILKHSSNLPPQIIELAMSSYYKNRILFALACDRLKESSLFSHHFGKIFSSICSDPVPNVRIACAHTVKNADLNDTYWIYLKNRLKFDFDSDVRKVFSSSSKLIFRPMSNISDNIEVYDFEVSGETVMEFIE